MGYRSKRKSLINVRKLVVSIAATVLCLSVVAVCILSVFVPVESWKYYFSLPNAVAAKVGELKLHYLDAENGDCVLIQLPDGKTALVGGGADDGRARENIFRYLNALKIKSLDALIVPDPSQRGVGALRGVIDYYDVARVYLPTVGKSGSAYAAFVSEIERRGIPSYDLTVGEIWGGAYSLRVLYPLKSGLSVEETVLALSYGETDVLLCGHCDEETYQALMLEKELGLWEKWGTSFDRFDVMQVQTGIDCGTLADFIEVFSCETAIISCRGGESYSPSEELLQTLGNLDVQAFRTDKIGHVAVTVGNNGYTVDSIRS
jgi:competence protein ComEC